MPKCQNPDCGAWVTPKFARVLGDNDETVHVCPHCPDEDKHGIGERVAGITTDL